jgi:hypothetical protein
MAEEAIVPDVSYRKGERCIDLWCHTYVLVWKM